MGKDRQVITVAASLDSLLPVRDFLKEQSAAVGLSTEGTMDLITAVDEALTNIIVHGCQHDEACTIDLEAEPTGTGLNVRLLDRTADFDPTSIPEPDLSIPLHQRPIGGLGIYMMKQSVDEVSYQPRPGGGNILTLRKDVKGSAHG